MGGVSVPQNPYLNAETVNGFNGASKFLGSGPTTTLPSNMVSNVQLGSYPSFLQFNQKTNPLFNGSLQQLQSEYQSQLYNKSTIPQLGALAEQQFLGGQLGTGSSSSYGANEMGSAQAAGTQDAFLGGQSYYDDLLNNFLNERSNMYNTQLGPQMQADMFNQQQNLAGLGMINNYNLDAAGIMENQASIAGGLNNAQGKLGLDAQEYNAASRAGALSAGLSNLGGLIGGGAGLLSGGGNSGLGSLAGSSGPFSLGGGSGGFSTLNDPAGSLGGFQMAPYMVPGGNVNF